VLTAGNVLPPVWFIDLRPRAGYLRDIPLALEEFLLARKILLADDSVTAQNMGRKILADAGYEVIAVNNGSAALKKIAELKPDLVILDVYMPGYSGLEVCQRLKESQDTARIPVLLTVGKLEPFKPEEAQRVRAEGYIVKPFEASELLSALSKLEDKVVPRAEPSKPGRFARAMAAADESSAQKEPSSTETGWKNRIAFPHKKTEAEEASAEESQFVTGNGAKKSAGNNEKRHESSPLEARVDVAAFAPIGVPKDVTAAEVAAITAAAARMQMAETSTRDEHRTFESTPSQTSSEFPVQPSLERYQGSRSDEIQPIPAAESTPPTNAVTPVSEVTATELDHSRNGDSLKGDPKLSGEKLDDAQDVPVTMAAPSESAAAASAGSSRWTAVPVALESNETSISLDHEMQKAYAAFAPADHVTTAGTVEAEPAFPESSIAQTEATVEPNAPSIEASTPSIEQPVVAVSNSEPAAVPEFEPTPAVANIETAQIPDFAKPDENAGPSAQLSSRRDPEFVAPVEPESRTAESATTSPEAPSLTTTENSEPKLDSETVKTTAAAWANWRQIRDTGPSTEKPQPQSTELVAPEPASPDTAALAVAAGAERALQEVSFAAPNRSPEDVASIVDSVLAGLRSKLMEEITRKMAEKK
jgi:two-component system chemotaxis response regulator CheY